MWENFMATCPFLSGDIRRPAAANPGEIYLKVVPAAQQVNKNRQPKPYVSMPAGYIECKQYGMSTLTMVGIAN
jgi:hypothetical protein